MPMTNFLLAAFLGGLLRASVFAYFGNALTEASWAALLAPLGVLAIVLTVPLCFESGRDWLRNLFRPDPRPQQREPSD